MNDGHPVTMSHSHDLWTFLVFYVGFAILTWAVYVRGK